MTDLTVALVAHDEALVAGPAIRSADAACRRAEAEGLAVERLIGLDRPTEPSREFFRQPALGSWWVSEHELGDLALTRNALVTEATGVWIAFLGCEHLVSENWLVAAVELLRSRERAIVHPELRWVFDREAAVYAVPGDDDPLYAADAYHLGDRHGSVCAAPREAFLEVPYAAADPEARLGFPDWQFNVETTARGWRHVVAPDTIVFERRRELPQPEPRGQRSLVRALEPLAIDRISTMGATG